MGPSRTFQDDDDVVGGCYNSGGGDDDGGCGGYRTSPHFSRPSRVAFARVGAVAVKNLSTLSVRILKVLRDPQNYLIFLFSFN